MNWPTFPTLLKRVAFVLSAITVCILLLVGTSAGRTWILQTGLTLFSSDSLHIQAKGVRSSSWFNWKIAELNIYRNSKPWLKLKNVSVDSSIKGLTEQQLTIANISTASLDYFPIDLPERNSEAHNIAFESNPWQLDLQHIRADRITLHHPHKPPSFSFEGSLQASAANQSIALTSQINALNKKPFTLSLNANLENRRISLSGTLHEIAGGYLGSAAHWPENQNLTSTFDVVINNVTTKPLIRIQPFITELNGHKLTLAAVLEYSLYDNSFTMRESQWNIDGNINTALVSYTPTATEKQVNIDVETNHFPLDLLSPWLPSLHSGDVTGRIQTRGNIAPIIQASSLEHTLQAFANMQTTVILDSAISWQSEPLAFSAHAKFSAQSSNNTLVVSPSRIDIAKLELKEALHLVGTTANTQNILAKPSSIQFSGNSNVKNGNTRFSAKLISNNNELFSLLAPAVKDIHFKLPAVSITGSGNLYHWAHKQWHSTNFTAQGSTAGTYQELPLTLNFSASGSPNKIHIHQLELSALDSLLSAVGNIDLNKMTSDITVSLAKTDIRKIKSIAAVKPFINNALATTTGDISATLKISDKLANPNVIVDFKSHLDYDSRMSGTVLARGLWHNNNLSIDFFDFSENQSSSTFSLAGDLNFTTPIPTSNVTLKATNISGQWLSLAGWPDPNGSAHGSLAIKSPGTKAFSRRWLTQLSVNGSLIYNSQYTREGNTYRIDNVTEVSTNKSLRFTSNFLSNNKTVGVVSLETTAQEATKLLDSTEALPRTIIRTQFNLAELNVFLPKGETIQGSLLTNLVIEGNIDAPQINGTLELSAGSYSNEAKNNYLDNIQLKSTAVDTVLVIDSISAQDNENGTISGHGILNWQDLNAENALNISIALRNSNIVSDERLHGKVSGDLTLTGNQNNVVLGGTLQLSPFYISIANAASSSVPHINVEYRHQDTPHNPTKKRGTRLPILWLDLAIAVAEQAYVEGRGLYSELEGKVFLSGPTTAINYRGNVKTVRGTFDIFGKRFLLKRGNLNFSNDSVAVAVNGNYKSKDIEISVDVSGTTEQLNVTFHSNPELPQDEIIANLIFGRSIKEMSAIQALQLASAISTLQGQKSRFDIMGNARDILGVNTLTIDTNENTVGEKGVAIGAGKYLTDNVYLEVEHTSNSTTPWLGTITIELTPNITLEGTSGSSEKSATSKLIWKRDY